MIKMVSDVGNVRKPYENIVVLALIVIASQVLLRIKYAAMKKPSRQAENVKI